MTTPVNHLDHLSILNLDFDIWSGKVKLTASDIKLGAGGEIPPENLAHLGQKKVIDSDKLRPFHRLKTSARRLCLGYGMPFLNGFAVPTDKVDELISQLDKIVVQMETEKRDFINGYDDSVTEWVDGNPDYAQTIRVSSLPKVVVEQRIGFDYQIFKINPVNDEQAQKLSTMASGLGNELLEEIVSEANEFFHKNINARTSCQASTKKTLLRLRNKVDGLSFLDSKFLSVVLLLDDTLKGYDAVTKKVEGGLFYQLMAAILVLSSKNKIQEYAEGSIDVSAMANRFFQSEPGVNTSSASDGTETEDPETTQVVADSVTEVEAQGVAQLEVKETIDVIPSDFEIPDDDDLDSYFKGCDNTESKPVFLNLEGYHYPAGSGASITGVNPYEAIKYFSGLPIVASHYGEMFGVKVAIGNWASTDGETITLPNISEEFAHKDVIWGLLAHESAHVKHTDFSVVKGMKSNEEFRFNMLNAIEDTRIESEMIDQFPGVRRDLEVVMDYMIQTGKLSPVSQNDTPGQIISAKVHYWGCSKLLQQQMMDALLKSADTAMEAKFTKGVCTRLEVLLRKMSQCRSTSDCLELTDNILAMLEDEAKKEEEKANNDDSSSNDKSSAGNDQDQNSDQNSSGSNDQGSDDDSQSGSNSKDDKSTPDQSDASNGADNQKQDSLSHGDKAKANQAAQQIREALNSSSDDLNEDAFDQLKAELSQEATQNGDDSYCTVPTAPDTAGNLSQGLKLLSDVKGTTSKIRAQLMGLVQATRQNRNWARRKGRRLCGNRMHRVMSGDLRVFKTREDRVEANTGVHVLTDLSSSMNASDAQIAREASLAIALALEAISGVSPAVTYFSGDSSDPVRSALRHGQLVRYNISHFIEPARGTTPMAEGIWFAAFELSKLREARKIIIVITDGSPDSSNACHKVIELCENSGIEMVGIGINTSRVEAFFNRSIMIENVDELRSTLFQLMRDKLTIEAA